jgi:hypothetical protein
LMMFCSGPSTWLGLALGWGQPTPTLSLCLCLSLAEHLLEGFLGDVQALEPAHGDDVGRARRRGEQRALAEVLALACLGLGLG